MYGNALYAAACNSNKAVVGKLVGAMFNAQATDFGNKNSPRRMWERDEYDAKQIKRLKYHSKSWVIKYFNFRRNQMEVVIGGHSHSNCLATFGCT